MDSIPGCASTIFPVHDVTYKKVCGKVIGYQYRQTNGFGPARITPNINETYVDGVSITRGTQHQHIWTLAAAGGERYHLDIDGTTPHVLALISPVCLLELSHHLLAMTIVVRLEIDKVS